MAVPAYPSFSASGYVTDPNEIIGLMFGDACIIRHNDTALFRNDVFSIPKIVAAYGNRPTDFTSNLNAGLRDYYSKIFEIVRCDIYIQDRTEPQYTVSIDMVLSLNNVTYSLGRTLSVDPSENVAKVIDGIKGVL